MRPRNDLETPDDEQGEGGDKREIKQCLGTAAGQNAVVNLQHVKRAGQHQQIGNEAEKQRRPKCLFYSLRSRFAGAGRAPRRWQFLPARARRPLRRQYRRSQADGTRRQACVACAAKARSRSDRAVSRDFSWLSRQQRAGANQALSWKARVKPPLNDVPKATMRGRRAASLKPREGLARRSDFVTAGTC